MRVRARLRPSRTDAGTRRYPNRLVRRGVAGAVLAFVVLGALHALTVPVFQPPDEASHWGYARLVSEGELPEITTLIPVEGVERAERAVAWRSTRKYRSVWVANHPPLFYVVMAGPVRAGVETGQPVGAVQFARLLSVLIAAGGIVLVAGIVRELLPNRPGLAVATAALTAAVPTFVKTASNLYNDSLAFTTAMAALLLAVRIVMRGPTGLRVALLAVFASAAALTRASGLVVAGVAVLAVVVRPFLPSPPGTWRGPLAARVKGRATEALRHGVVVAATVAATAGWFYLRNLTLYGDLTGAQALLDVFDRDFREPVPAILASWEYWRDQLRNLLDYTFNLPIEGSPSGWLWLLVALPALGGVMIALRRLRRHLAGTLELPPEHAATRAHRAVAIALLAILAASVEVALAQFFRDGGGLHARYLLPTMPLLGLIAAIGLAELPGGRRGLPAGALFAGMAAVNVWLWNQYLWIVTPPQPPQHTIEIALAAAEVSDPATVLTTAGALLLVAVAMQVSALWSLGAPAMAVPAPPPPLTFRVERIREERTEREEPVEPVGPVEPMELEDLQELEDLRELDELMESVAEAELPPAEAELAPAEVLLEPEARPEDGARAELTEVRLEEDEARPETAEPSLDEDAFDQVEDTSDQVKG